MEENNFEREMFQMIAGLPVGQPGRCRQLGHRESQKRFESLQFPAFRALNWAETKTRSEAVLVDHLIAEKHFWLRKTSFERKMFGLIKKVRFDWKVPKYFTENLKVEKHFWMKDRK